MKQKYERNQKLMIIKKSRNKGWAAQLANARNFKEFNAKNVN